MIGKSVLAAALALAASSWQTTGHTAYTKQKDKQRQEQVKAEAKRKRVREQIRARKAAKK